MGRSHGGEGEGREVATSWDHQLGDRVWGQESAWSLHPNFRVSLLDPERDRKLTSVSPRRLRPTPCSCMSWQASNLLSSNICSSSAVSKMTKQSASNIKSSSKVFP